MNKSEPLDHESVLEDNKPIDSEELYKLKCILMINACIKFNLVPPVDSEEWNKYDDRYALMYLHILPGERIDDINDVEIMKLLGESSKASSPIAKLNLYRKVAEVTGYSPEQLAPPNLQKSINLSALCAYTLFKNPPKDQDTLPDHLLGDIKQWGKFDNSLPQHYLWETHLYRAPWTASITAAAFCLNLHKQVEDPTVIPCLYGLAVVLERDDIIERLESQKPDLDKMPENTKAIYDEFLSSLNTNTPEVEGLEIKKESAFPLH